MKFIIYDLFFTLLKYKYLYVVNKILSPPSPRSVIIMLNCFSSHFLTYSFASEIPEGSSLLFCLESQFVVVHILIYVSTELRLDARMIIFCFDSKVSIPVMKSLGPVATLTDEATIVAWSNKGLPSDRMSVENATVLTYSKHWPLMIHPPPAGN